MSKKEFPEYIIDIEELWALILYAKEIKKICIDTPTYYFVERITKKIKVRKKKAIDNLEIYFLDNMEKLEKTLNYIKLKEGNYNVINSQNKLLKIPK